MTRELPPLTASPTETTHFMQQKEQHLSDRARLLALYDAAAECRCSVTLREAEEPEAATQLSLWAAARHLPVRRDHGAAWRVLEVETSTHRTITVYLHVEV